MRPMGRKFREFLGRYGSDLPAGNGFKPKRQQRQLYTGELQMAYKKEEQQQSSDKPPYRYTARANDGISSGETIPNKLYNAFVQAGQWLGFGPRADVYDLVNCGPRNRFVVFGDDGPLIVHNCTQALCRDLLAGALLNVDAAGWPVILHVHDEVVCEVPDTDEYTVSDLEKLMCELPDWADGFPLAAEGDSMYRYAK